MSEGASTKASCLDLARTFYLKIRLKHCEQTPEGLSSCVCASSSQPRDLLSSAQPRFITILTSPSGPVLGHVWGRWSSKAAAYIHTRRAISNNYGRTSRSASSSHHTYEPHCRAAMMMEEQTNQSRRSTATAARGTKSCCNPVAWLVSSSKLGSRLAHLKLRLQFLRVLLCFKAWDTRIH